MISVGFNGAPCSTVYAHAAVSASYSVLPLSASSAPGLSTHGRMLVHHAHIYRSVTHALLVREQSQRWGRACAELCIPNPPAATPRHLAYSYCACETDEIDSAQMGSGAAPVCFQLGTATFGGIRLQLMTLAPPVTSRPQS